MRSYHRKHFQANFVPFLCLVLCGLVAVSIFYFWVSWGKKAKDEALGRVFIYAVEPDVKYLSWGSDIWQSINKDQPFLVGDSLRTSNEGRAVLELYGGNMIRMDKNSELKLEAFDDVNGNKQVLFILEQGRVWVNNRTIDDAVHIVFDTDNLQIVSVGEFAQYLVEQDLSEKVFAFQGSLRVSVRDLQSGSSKIFESFTISQDEYIEISENDVRLLASFRSIEPISKIPQDVSASDWVFWNQKEDAANF